MAAINPYLNFNGNTEEAFNFYKSVFGGEFLDFQRFKDIPQGAEMSESDANKMMHVSLRISDSFILMATDLLESAGHKLVLGNNFSIAIAADSKEEADKLFNGLAEGGKIEMPIADTFWGAYFGMLTDKFDIQWMVNFDPK